MNEELKEIVLEKLKFVKGLNPKSGMSYALQHFSELMRVGTGISRREITRGTDELSPFIHGFSTFHRYMGTCKEFVLFCQSRGVNKLHKVTYKEVEDFLMKKIHKARRKSTIKSNMCALKKFFNASNRPDLKDQLDSDCSRFKDLARPGGTIHAFDNVKRLIAKIGEKSRLSAVIAQLIYMSGVRIHELRSMQITDTAILVPRGKGGKERTLDFSHRLDELAEIKNLMAELKELSKDIDWKSYCQRKGAPYQAHVKGACRSLADEYAGAHGLRANYAQQLCRKLEGKGSTTKETERTITRDLGHERRPMARHYLRV